MLKQGTIRYSMEMSWKPGRIVSQACGNPSSGMYDWLGKHADKSVGTLRCAPCAPQGFVQAFILASALFTKCMAHTQVLTFLTGNVANIDYAEIQDALNQSYVDNNNATSRQVRTGFTSTCCQCVVGSGLQSPQISLKHIGSAWVSS